MLRRRQVEPDDVGGLDGELGIVGEAPGCASRKIDPLRPQKSPDVLVADVAEVSGDQRRGPPGKPHGRRPVEHGQDAPIGVLAVCPRLARARRIAEPGQAVAGKTQPPFAHHAARAADLAGDRPARHAGGRRQHDLARSTSRCSVLGPAPKPRAPPARPPTTRSASPLGSPCPTTIMAHPIMLVDTSVPTIVKVAGPGAVVIGTSL